MNRFLFVGGLLCTLLSFLFFTFSLMNLFPMLIAGPCLFLSIVVSLHLFNQRNRFKGFRS